MSDQKTFTERAAAIRDKAADVEAAPVFTKMKLAQDIAMEAALLVADMAERLDAKTPYIDEVQERFNSEAG